MSDKLQKVGGFPPPVEVDIKDEIVTEEMAIEDLKAAGMVVVPKEHLKRIARVGVYLKGVGVLKMQRGQALITQQRLDESLRSIANELRKLSNSKRKANRIKDMCMLAHEIGFLSDKLTSSQQMLVEIEHVQAPAGLPDEEPINRPFALGAKVKSGNTIVAQTVNIMAENAGEG